MNINDDRVKFIQHKKQKYASAARNSGIKEAKGTLIAFLDDDDEWLPTKLEKQVQLLLNLPKKVGMVYCWMDYYNQAGDIMMEVHPNLSGSIFKETLDKQPIGNSSTLLLRRVVIDDIGVFDELLPRGNDGDFIRRVCQTYEVDFVPEVLARVYVGHNDRISLWNSHSRNRVFEYIKRLEFYASDFDQHPDKKLNILLNMSLDYILMGNVGKGLHCFWKAMRCRCRSWHKISAFFAFTKRFVRTFFPDAENARNRGKQEV